MFTVYKTTNLTSNKFYIGVHETDDPNDSYLGSGEQITAAIKKYGVENFRKDVLFTCNDRELAYIVESRLVTEKEVRSAECYNLKIGGIGGWDHWNPSKEAKDARAKGGKKASEINAQKGTGRCHDPKHRFSKDNPYQQLGNLPENRVKAAAKARETFALIGHSKGSKNSQFGTVWCIEKDATHIIGRKKFKKELIPEGWISTQEWRKKKL